MYIKSIERTSKQEKSNKMFNKIIEKLQNGAKIEANIITMKYLLVDENGNGIQKISTVNFKKLIEMGLIVRSEKIGVNKYNYISK